MLHARLRRIVDADTDDEVHSSFRAVLNASPVASLNRLRSAVTASGIELSGKRRRLFVLRNTAWSQGRKTQQALDRFRAHGGAVVTLPEADLKVFRALQQLLEDQPTGLTIWLKERRHASGTALLASLSSEPAVSAALAEVGETPEAASSPKTAEPTGAGEPVRADTPSTTTEPPRTVAPSEVATTSEAARAPGPVAEDSILIGIAESTSRPVSVRLEDLRRHTVIFAGSGSGKTVLIRRLVEECALKGVSAVVLDPNNDLARLGLPWPEPPRAWLQGDAEKAARYLRDTEVVVWTPRLTTGRPLLFAPLAGLGDVAYDPDEFGIALDNAVVSLVPRSGLPASGARLSQGRAVLKEALAAYVQRGGGDLAGFLGYLSALPQGVSRLASGEKLAADIAQTLLAETVNDPMLGGTGEAVDPSVLLQPAGGRRARISVISLVGLPNDEQRQHFGAP